MPLEIVSRTYPTLLRFLFRCHHGLQHFWTVLIYRRTYFSFELSLAVKLLSDPLGGLGVIMPSI